MASSSNSRIRSPPRTRSTSVAAPGVRRPRTPSTPAQRMYATPFVRVPEGGTVDSTSSSDRASVAKARPSVPTYSAGSKSRATRSAPCLLSNLDLQPISCHRSDHPKIGPSRVNAPRTLGLPQMTGLRSSRLRWLGERFKIESNSGQSV